VAMSIQYVGACKQSDLLCHGRTVRRGRELTFTEISATDADGKVVAHGIQTHASVSIWEEQRGCRDGVLLLPPHALDELGADRTGRRQGRLHVIETFAVGERIASFNVGGARQ